MVSEIWFVEVTTDESYYTATLQEIQDVRQDMIHTGHVHEALFAVPHRSSTVLGSPPPY